MKRTISKSLLALLVLAPGPLFSQGVAVSASRWLSSPKVSDYRLGLNGFGVGPLRYGFTLQYLRQGASGGSWGGMGSDFTLRTTPAARPYLLGGVAFGMGRDSIGKALGPGVGAWGGVGAELFAWGSLGIQAEAVYGWQSKFGVRSISLGFRLGSRVGRETAPRGAASRVTPTSADPAIPRAAAADEETMRRAATAPVTADASATRKSIIGTALGAMGTPYRWGGTDLNGFDCSGLIQFAYAQQGIALPRRSVEQARYGREVGRSIDELVAGDILTFAAQPGGDVAHVGLYLGDGKFIHSASQGVQVSALSADDPAGKWWWERWAGARRIIEQ